jgi:hypothetical protein
MEQKPFDLHDSSFARLIPKIRLANQLHTLTTSIGWMNVTVITALPEGGKLL